MKIRKAKIHDPTAIAALVNAYADEGLMLPRALNDIYENLRDFFVCKKDGELAGCAALHICWEGLGEVRSLAVSKKWQNHGLGKRLLQACLAEAVDLGMERVFTLTFEPEFFINQGFKVFPKDKLPHKVWSDCLRCPHFPNCDETALIFDLGT